jgi:hypothetical protein
VDQSQESKVTRCDTCNRRDVPTNAATLLRSEAVSLAQGNCSQRYREACPHKKRLPLQLLGTVLSYRVRLHVPQPQSLFKIRANTIFYLVHKQSEVANNRLFHTVKIDQPEVEARFSSVRISRVRIKQLLAIDRVVGDGLLALRRHHPIYERLPKVPLHIRMLGWID